jgi:transposase-like protein
MRPENLFKLTPELKHAINRHPAANRQLFQAGTAVKAAPAENVSRSGKSGKRPRWRCHQCGEGFTAWAAAERHRHRNPYGGDVGRIELVL